MLQEIGLDPYNSSGKSSIALLLNKERQKDYFGKDLSQLSSDSLELFGKSIELEQLKSLQKKVRERYLASNGDFDTCFKVEEFDIAARMTELGKKVYDDDCPDLGFIFTSDGGSVEVFCCYER